MTELEASAIQKHLDLCETCQLVSRRVRRTAVHIREEIAPPERRRLVEGILAGVRKWDARLSNPGYLQVVKCRVAMEIGPFLGWRAANQLLQPVSEDGKDMLSGIEPVLAEFLGCRAASRLVTHVVDAAIVRI